MKKIILTCVLIFIQTTLVFSQVWVQRLNGISMWSLAVDLQGNLYAGTSGTIKSIYKSTNGGENWVEVFSGGAANIIYIACDSNNNVYASYGSSGVLKSTNSGLNWTVIPPTNFNSNTVNSVKCGKNNYVYVGTTLGGIYISTDGGATFPYNFLSGSNIVSIYIDKYNSDIVYAGASAGTGNNGVYRSSNAGMNWSELMNSGVNCWAMVQFNPNELLYVGTSTGYPVYKSTNSGLNWFQITALPGAMRGAAINSAQFVYTAGNGGVYRSTNFGASFVNFGFTYSSNHCLAYGNKVYVAASGTTYGGVWFTVDSLVSGLGNSNQNLPSEFQLQQNYPNPFNSSTIIKYALPSSGNVTLILYDVTGKKIDVLIDEFKSAGVYQYRFQIDAISTGVYFYSLYVDNKFVSTKRMVYIK